jgi:hypothetical protein
MHCMRVGAHHLGCYAFKGCGTVEVVTCLADTSPVLAWPGSEQSKGGGAKGVLVSPACGPVVGLQGFCVTLPDVLPALRRAWRLAGARGQVATGVGDEGCGV